ncbi:hypothetical protein ACFLXZ_01175 [Chloroflexota bacterium]
MKSLGVSGYYGTRASTSSLLLSANDWGHSRQMAGLSTFWPTINFSSLMGLSPGLLQVD